MQLDRTQIAVRERGILETLDLALHVMKAHFWPLMVTMCFLAVPLAVLNHVLIGWMVQLESDQALTLSDAAGMMRYGAAMTLLVVIEAPLASVFATAYLGQAVFLEKPGIRRIVTDVTSLFPRIIWCHVILRGVAAAWLLMLAVDRDAPFSAAEGWLIVMGLIVAAWRAARPFMNEVILLERIPLSSRNEQTMTIGRRSALLHNPRGSDLFNRWLVTAILSVALTFAVFMTTIFMSGVFFYDWIVGPVMIQICLPLSMWLVASYITVVRFLCYLDLRIRQEGWEVELRLRAEANRLRRSVA